MFAYDAEVLTSFHALYNAAVWPAPAMALALGLIALWLAVPPRRGGRSVGLLLTAAWLWCGLVYFLRYFAVYDFMAPVYGGAFLLQAALLAWGLVWRERPLRFRSEPTAGLGLGLAAAALFGLPLLTGLGAAGFAAAPLVGLAPGPTALFTLGLLLQAPGRPPWPLAVIPLAWCAFAGVRAWALGLPGDGLLALLGFVAAVLLLWRPGRNA